MAFSDPITQVYNPVYAAPTGGTASNWRKIADGVYQSENLGSIDEPIRIIVKNAPPASNTAETRFEVQVTQSKNVAVPSGITTSSVYEDDTCVVSCVVRFTPRSFTAANIDQSLRTLCGFLNVGVGTSVLSRLMMGEK